MNLDKKTKEILLSAHRTWIQSDLMFSNFESTKVEVNSKNFKTFFVSNSGVYMLLWYALLFATCEILKENDLIPKTIEKEINEIYDPLRRIRNAAFHAQDKYWSPKFFEIMKVSNSVKIIRKIHRELGHFFLDLTSKYSG